MMIDRLATFIATFGYSGLLRPAPGTWGSLAALPCGWLILWQGGTGALLVAALIASAVGFWAAERHMDHHRTMHDPSEIVIDEAAGQWLAMLPLAATDWPGVIAAFILFRLFDIWKPGPVGWADRRLKGAAGVMADDIIAGLFAASCIWAVQYGLEM